MSAVGSILECPVSDFTREAIPFLLAVVAIGALPILVPEGMRFIPDMIFGPG